MNTPKTDKTNLSLSLRRVRKPLRTEVSTGRAALAMCNDGTRVQPSSCGYSNGNG